MKGGNLATHLICASEAAATENAVRGSFEARRNTRFALHLHASMVSAAVGHQQYCIAHPPSEYHHKEKGLEKKRKGALPM
jgi:hypothetical protein